MKGHFKYFYILFFIIITYLSFIIAKPYLTAIMAGGIVAYIFFPLYEKLRKKVSNKNLSSALMCIFILVLIILPIVLVINSASQEARYFYIRAKQTVFSGEFFDYECENGPLCQSITKVQEFGQSPEIKIYTEQALGKFSDFVLDEASQIVFAIPRLLLLTFISFFIVFYLFVDGKEIVSRMKHLLPIKREFRKEVFDKIDNVTHAVIYGSIIIALIQGSLGALGYILRRLCEYGCLHCLQML